MALPLGDSEKDTYILPWTRYLNNATGFGMKNVAHKEDKNVYKGAFKNDVRI